MGTLAPTAGTLLDGVYVLQQPIGRGAAGQVWLAEDMLLHRRCAVKVVPPELIGGNNEAWRNALRREASAMAALRHPNIAGVYAFGRHKDLHYFIMEWVDGETLATEIERRRQTNQPIPIRRGLRIIAEACRGLAAVHKVGIVHRDVKPTNLMLSKDGRVVLIDFGLVRMPDGAGPGGAPVGTPRYMAPELARPTERPAPEDMHLADLYSLGATAYELFTGSPPFPGEGAREVIQRHLSEPPEAPSKRRPDLPAVVDRLLLRALAKKPNERYSSAEDFRAAISAVAARLRPSEPASTTPRVLVVDDDDGVARALERILRSDYDVTVARSGEQALDILVGGNAFDAMLVDIAMPGIDGPELYERIRARWPGLEKKIVFATGGAFTAASRAFLARVPNSRFEKPITREELRPIVASVVDAA